MERKERIRKPKIVEVFRSPLGKFCLKFGNLRSEGNLDNAIPSKKIALEPIESGPNKAAT